MPGMATPGVAEHASDPLRDGLAAAVQRTLRALTTVPEIHAAGCLLLDTGGELRHTADAEQRAGLLELAEQLSAEGPAHEAFARGRASVADLRHEARWERLRNLLGDDGLRPVLGSPLVIDDQTIGAIHTVATRRRTAGPATRATGRAAGEIAELLARALEDRLDERGDELTSRLRASLPVRRRLAAAVRAMSGGSGDREPGLPGEGEAMLRLRQFAAMTDQTTIDVADQVLDHGGRLSLTDLATQAASVRRTREQLVHLALSDPLTGVANRTRFLDHLRQAIARASRTGQHPAVVFVDLDRFKEVNDTFGHAAGDEVLRTVATRLRAQVRAQDTVARLGGDEFAVLCEAPEGPQGARRLARRITAAVAEPIELASWPGVDRPVTVRRVCIRASVGVASAVEEPLRAEDLLEAADRAMYDAKAAGGGRVGGRPDRRASWLLG